MQNVLLLNISFCFYRDDHGFSPLHWCCKEGHLKLAELLVSRGARVNATNRGDDTPLHLASAHGHKEIVQLVMRTEFNDIVCDCQNYQFKIDDLTCSCLKIVLT